MSTATSRDGQDCLELDEDRRLMAPTECILVDRTQCPVQACKCVPRRDNETLERYIVDSLLVPNWPYRGGDEKLEVAIRYWSEHLHPFTFSALKPSNPPTLPPFFTYLTLLYLFSYSNRNKRR